MEQLNSIIFYNLDKAIRTYRSFAQKKLKENGFEITVDQWLVLKAITENPKITQNEISHIVFKDNASVTRIITLLVKSKYLVRDIDTNDRRKTNLEITVKGKELLMNVQSTIENNRNIALAGISNKDLHLMNEHLINIAKNCEKKIT